MSTATNPLPYASTTDRRDMFAAFAMLGYVLQGETDARKIAEGAAILADTLTDALENLQTASGGTGGGGVKARGGSGGGGVKAQGGGSIDSGNSGG